MAIRGATYTAEHERKEREREREVEIWFYRNGPWIRNRHAGQPMHSTYYCLGMKGRDWDRKRAMTCSHILLYDLEDQQNASLKLNNDRIWWTIPLTLSTFFSIGWMINTLIVNKNLSCFTQVFKGADGITDVYCAYMGHYYRYSYLYSYRSYCEWSCIHSHHSWLSFHDFLLWKQNMYVLNVCFCVHTLLKTQA